MVAVLAQVAVSQLAVEQRTAVALKMAGESGAGVCVCACMRACVCVCVHEYRTCSIIRPPFLHRSSAKKKEGGV